MDPELMEGIKHQQAYEMVTRHLDLIHKAVDGIQDGSSQTDVSNPILKDAMQLIFMDLLAFEHEWWYRL